MTQLPSQSLEAYQQFLRCAIEGGVTSIQLRIKDLNPFDFYDMACEIKTMLDSLQIPLIINDHVEFAQKIDAHGVHLGQSDMPPLEARAYLGQQKIMGLSIETIEQLHHANTLTCIDYVAASAVFPSQTKTDCKTIWGIQGLKELVQLSKYPVVAIGGIYSHNARDVIAAGAEGLAVVSAIHEASDPKMAAEQLISVYRGKNDAI